jgi:hypothetical protein
VAHKIDIEVYGQMGFYSILGASPEGIIFLSDRVCFESWQGSPEDGISVDAGNYAQAIADGAVEDGLTVVVNGISYRAGQA